MSNYKNNHFKGTIVESYTDDAYRHKNRKRYSQNSKFRGSFFENNNAIVTHPGQLQVIPYNQYQQSTNQRQYRDFLVCPGKSPQEITNRKKIKEQENSSGIMGGFGNMVSRFYNKLTSNKSKIFTAKEERENKDYKKTKIYKESENNSFMSERHYNKRTGESITRSFNVSTRKKKCKYYHNKHLPPCRFGNACKFAH